MLSEVSESFLHKEHDKDCHAFKIYVHPSLKIYSPFLSPSPDDFKNISRKIQITKHRNFLIAFSLPTT